MWPFARRHSRVITEIDTRIPSRLAGIDFSHNGAVIKLWLCEPIRDAIDLLCDTHDASRPDVLRWVLFEHVYGRIEFGHLLRARGNFAPVIHSPALRDSTARSSPQDLRLGKASEDIKLHLPGALKDELLGLADAHARPVSDYVRGVLQQTLFGAGSLRRAPRRPEQPPSHPPWARSGPPWTPAVDIYQGIAEPPQRAAGALHVVVFGDPKNRDASPI